MTEREKAHKELEHALAAFGDGLAVLNQRRPASYTLALAIKLAQGIIERDALAAWAFRNAVAGVRTGGFELSDEGYLPALRKLAPVLLDIYCDAKGIE